MVLIKLGDQKLKVNMQKKQKKEEEDEEEIKKQ